MQIQEPANEGQEGHLGGGGNECAHNSPTSTQVRPAAFRPDQIADQETDLQEGLGLHEQIQHQEEKLEVR